jgi:5'-deoxynucleotidase YfbR-like HD superfamily hydrolase
MTNWNDLISVSSGDIRRLSHTIRFSSIPVTYSESTAEHTFWVALYAVLIHNNLQQKPDGILPSLLIHALTHDAPECVTGDVVRTFKYSSPELKNQIDEAENRLVEDLFPIAIKDLFKMIEQNLPSPESAKYVKDVVKAADWMSLFQFMRREAARHNFEIIPYFNGMIEDLDSTAESFANASDPYKFQLMIFYQTLASRATQIRADCFNNAFQFNEWNRKV